MAKFYDTLIAEYIKNPWRRWLWLDDLALNSFDYQMISYDELTNKWKIPFKDISLFDASNYSWEDVYITNKIYEKQVEEWFFDNKILNEIEFPLIQVLKKMEITWVKINKDKLKEIWVLLETEIKSLEKEIFALAWEEFNIKSPKQVWELLFEKMNLPKWKKTKTGYSVDSEVLEELAVSYPIAEKISLYRHYSKILSTYVEWLLPLLDKNDLLHSNYNQTIASTWRLSSINPNLQNIPASSWIAWQIREAFVSRFEWGKIMAFDYSQIEVRLLAIMSQDQNLLEAFEKWEDIHDKTAKLIWTENRKIAKAVNFWIIYGISAFWLSKQINIWVAESKKYIDEFYENYPKVREFFDKIISDCEKTGYVETMFWRKRFIAGINDRNKMIKSWAEREATNMPIQWTSADIIKLAMIEVEDFLRNSYLLPPPNPLLGKEGETQQSEVGGGLKSQLIMQVHDELVFDVFPWEEEILKENIVEIMSSILNKTELFSKKKLWIKKLIPLKVDFWIWENWREGK